MGNEGLKFIKDARKFSVMDTGSYTLGVLEQPRNQGELVATAGAHPTRGSIWFLRNALVTFREATGGLVDLFGGDAPLAAARFHVVQHTRVRLELIATAMAMDKPFGMGHVVLWTISKASRRGGKNQKLTAL